MMDVGREQVEKVRQKHEKVREPRAEAKKADASKRQDTRPFINKQFSS